MRRLADLERFFEGLFERPATRLFRTRLQPIQLQRRIERAMESERATGADRTYVPTRFIVHLGTHDHEAFADVADLLAAELADAALRFARAHHYALAARPSVSLVEDPLVRAGELRVEARFIEAARRDAAVELHADEEDDLARTRRFEAPRVDAATASLRVTSLDGREMVVTVDGRLLTIGRAPDNGLVLDDHRVSRHHARLQARRGALVLRDLKSTNGSRVNGVPVDEVVLGEGDRIELGDTVLLVERIPDG